MDYGNQYMKPGDRMGNLGNQLRPVEWQSVDAVPAQFNYYQGQRIARPESELESFRREHCIAAYGSNIPDPFLSFSELTCPDCIQRSFSEQGFEQPTPIQAVTWPILLASRDLVGIAKTGSGKTLAFMIPAILHIQAQPPLRLGDGPIVLVMAPTRELAMQIESESRKVVSRLPNIRSVCLYGGASKHEQARPLRAGVQICIATPGRLIDMLESGVTNLLRVTYLVLDEADRMLDMGFEPQIRKVCSQIRADRQTLMFSATWPEDVRGLASSFMRDFVRIHVGSTELMANTDVRQHPMLLQNHYDKMPALLDILRRHQGRALIFVKTKKSVDAIVDQLNASGLQALGIHGDKQQGQRDHILNRFRRDTHCSLVATDVAARGLDIKHLDVVVNYDFPMTIEDYVHRIGRTGRAGRSGDAYSFIYDENPKLIKDLRNLMHKAGQAVPPELENMRPVFSSSGRGGRGGSRYGGGGGGRNSYPGADGSNFSRYAPGGGSYPPQASYPPYESNNNNNTNMGSGGPPRDDYRPPPVASSYPSPEGGLPRGGEYPPSSSSYPANQQPPPQAGRSSNPYNPSSTAYNSSRPPEGPPSLSYPQRQQQGPPMPPRSLPPSVPMTLSGGVEMVPASRDSRASFAQQSLMALYGYQPSYPSGGAPASRPSGGSGPPPLPPLPAGTAPLVPSPTGDLYRQKRGRSPTFAAYGGSTGGGKRASSSSSSSSDSSRRSRGGHKRRRHHHHGSDDRRRKSGSRRKGDESKKKRKSRSRSHSRRHRHRHHHHSRGGSRSARKDGDKERLRTPPTPTSEKD